MFVPLNCLPEQATKALQQGLTLFGDKLYIKHTPTLHQEGWPPDLFISPIHCCR